MIKKKNRKETTDSRGNISQYSYPIKHVELLFKKKVPTKKRASLGYFVGELY